MRRVLVIVIFIASGLAGLALSLYLHSSSDDEVQTIQTFHYPANFVKQLIGDPHAGQKIFQEYCSACHSKNPSIDINAPRLGDEKAWKEKRAWGVDALLAITIHGQGAMPARGGCFECSDAQLREAILYLTR